MKSAILLFAHGARDLRWAEPFIALRDKVALLNPRQPVCLCFLELMTPSLPEAIASLVAQDINHMTVVPLFMAQGAHLRQDLPQLISALQQTYPNLTLSVTRALGDSPELLEAIAQWVGRQLPYSLA